MIKIQILTVLFFISAQFSSGMRVADWGVTSDINRLKFVTRDLFQEAFKIVSDDIYTLPDLKQTYDHTLKNNNATVQFRAYNGRFHNFILELINENGQLRRLILPKSPGKKQHEMIICGDCILLHTDKVNYLYEAYYGKYHSHGRIYSGPMTYWLSFQMPIINSYNIGTNQTTCSPQLEQVTLVLDSNHDSAKIENMGVLNFLADKLDTWLIQHLNTTVVFNLKNTLLHAINIVSENHYICDEFLSV
ncbi:uncharacterized protein LOC142325534 [Lycorma delicatula]|uniref:uncharacterized protein LOC142325528 n=1 Tax=Lycorma delicatula TaxID=130591 RepID=UPI003F517ABF